MIAPPRIIGYGLLILSLLDYLKILVPFRISVPVWGFQTFGALVEHSAVFVFGFLLIFLEADLERSNFEKRILRYLSFLALILGVGFFLLLPAGISSAYLMTTQNQDRLVFQISQQEDQLKQLNENINRASVPELLNLAQQLKQQGRAVDTDNLSTLKQQILSEVVNQQASALVQIKAANEAQFIQILRSTIKWGLGSVILGVLLAYTWKATYWTRLPGYLEPTPPRELEKPPISNYFLDLISPLWKSKSFFGRSSGASEQPPISSYFLDLISPLWKSKSSFGRFSGESEQPPNSNFFLRLLRKLWKRKSS
ncbi:MAG: HpsJ family protein [Leptolyngbyaceae bacterium]|nr:HpsJ family protein [Leptolyngbyaceae bacterium]